MHTIRVSLASAITELFLVGAVALAVALVVTFFLPEIPLRKSNRPLEAQAVATTPESEGTVYQDMAGRAG
jgi:hypothetical protein